MNIVIIQGNLGKDPDVTTTPSGAKVAKMTVATNESYKDKSSGEWVDKVEWHNVVCWAWLADKAESLRKGNSVLIEGILETQKWQDSDGNNRYSTNIRAWFLKSLDRKESDSKFPF